MVHQSLKSLTEAKEILIQSRGKLRDQSDRIEKAIELAALIQTAANAMQGKEEALFGQEMKSMMSDPKGKAFTTEMTDQAFRSSNAYRAADQLCYLLSRFGVPSFLKGIKYWGMHLFSLCGKPLAKVMIPIVQEMIRKETSRVILPGEKKAFKQHLEERRKEGIRVNLNHLGEAILGEEEAKKRLNTYLEDLKDPDVEYVSVKISTLFSQIHLLAWEETLVQLAEPYRRLLRAANQFLYTGKEGVPIPKFINLDMEEYRDLRLTVALFKQVLSEPEFLNTSAGIVLQSYLPDSYAILQELSEFSQERMSRGGAPLKVRIVKGANLAMETVEASMRGWSQAPFCHKVEVDANFKRMVHCAFQPQSAKALHVGIGSHNLFDLSYAMLLREEREVVPYVVFEMLEGMADASRRAIQTLTDEMLLYCPVAEASEFQNAVAYLVRRLDENTGPENYLRVSFGLAPGSHAWQKQADLFASAFRRIEKLPSVPRRQQNRKYIQEERGCCQFRNEPDTDFCLPQNRKWADEIFNKAQQESQAIPSITFLDREQVERALSSASVALSVEERLAALEKAVILFRENRGDLLAAMLLHSAKPLVEGDPEVSEAIDFIDYYIRSYKEWASCPDLKLSPKGVVLIASPWNFPCSIPTGGIAAALTAGNAVLFKPAPEAVHVGKIVAELFWKAGIPKEMLQFVPCEDSIAEKMVKDQRVDMVVLTGATETAKLLQRLRPGIDLAAETGGKNAIIVTAMADRDLAVKEIVHSAFGFAGQKCSACSLVVLEKEIYEDPQFKKQLLDAAESLKTSSQWERDCRVNPLIQPPSGALLRAVQSLDEGEEWILKPVISEVNPRLLSPGIKWGVKPGSFMHQAELFGPVIGVLCADDLDHAISIVNSTPYGLTTGLHSLDEREQVKWKEKIIAGNLYINRGITGAIVERQPFGGCKASSFGRGLKAGGPNYLLQFMHVEQKCPPADLSKVPDALDAWAAHFTEEERAAFKTACGSYSYYFRHYFRHEHDPLKILGQDNLQYYRPREGLILRVTDQDSDLEILCAAAAAFISGTPLEISMPSPRPRLEKLPAMVEGEREFIEKIEKSSFPRVRFLNKPSEFLAIELARLGSAACREPLLFNGRVELLHFLREVSLSSDYHRYGNLGLREQKMEKHGECCELAECCGC